MMQSPYFLLPLGFAILIASGDFLVRGSVSFARHFKVSTLLIGLIIVSLGTSAPELFVSLQAAFYGHPDISIGNVVGSNISNIALVLALTAVILPVPVNRKILVFDWPFMFLSGVVLLILAYFGDQLSFIDGLILLLMLAAYLSFSLKHSIKERKSAPEFKEAKYNIFVSSLMIVVSIAAMYFGANFLIDGASEVAKSLGVSERVISVSVVAFGTSIPELSTSIIAAIKKESDISLGNIIGSNIFNTLAILGPTAVISPINVDEKFINVDILWMLAISILLFLFLLTKKINRISGIILLALYGIYIYLAFA